MVHVIYHAGFHKTGTTSLQTWCRTNRRALSGRAGFLLPGVLRKEVSVWASRYSQFGETSDLRFFEDCLTERLAENGLADRPHLVISDENLLGHMPGPNSDAFADRATDLLRAAQNAVQANFDDAPMTLYLTLRDQAPWHRSLFHHHVTHHGETMTETRFAEGLAPLGPPQDLARQLADRTGLALQTAHLSRMGKVRHGIAAPLLDLLDVPRGQRGKLTPPPWDNRGTERAHIPAMRMRNAAALDTAPDAAQ